MNIYILLLRNSITTFGLSPKEIRTGFRSLHTPPLQGDPNSLPEHQRVLCFSGSYFPDSSGGERAKEGVLGEGMNSADTQNRAQKIIDPQMIEQENFGHPVYIGGHHNIK